MELRVSGFIALNSAGQRSWLLKGFRGMDQTRREAKRGGAATGTKHEDHNTSKKKKLLQDKKFLL